MPLRFFLLCFRPAAMPDHRPVSTSMLRLSLTVRVKGLGQISKWDVSYPNSYDKDPTTIM